MIAFGDRQIVARAKRLLALNDEVWADMAARPLQGPVRLGVPGTGLTGATNAVATPVYATGVGLAMYGSLQGRNGGLAGATRAVARVGGWIRDFF